MKQLRKRRAQRRALLMSGLSLLLCTSMLIGSTFAWFTDSVTSTGNIVQSGTLDVQMLWADGDLDPADTNTTWEDASTGAIFNYTKWEPGYVQARHLKITNTGDLALKYQMRVIANGVVSELADVIDVFLFDEATKVSRDSLPEDKKVGTLSEVLLQPSGSIISKNIAGNLIKDQSKTVTLVLKMRENAGNEYQDLSIGSDFSVQLLATQLSYENEKDSFDEFYDSDSDYATQEVPKAMVYRLNSQTAANINIIDQSKNPLGTGLDTAYSFQPTETYEQALSSEYSWAHADFFVYADNDVPAKSMMLAGYYSLFGDFLNIDENTWIGLTADMDVLAGEEHGIRLLGDGMGLSVAYNEICNYGNDGTGFLCGATDVTGENAGTTLTVELRLYKVACEDPGCHHNNSCETGDYITVGKFTYTFPGERPVDPALNPDDGSTPVNGDTYVDGVYTYTYDAEEGGWSLGRVSDTSKTSYEPILESINGEPVALLSQTFLYCKNMTSAPEIPSGVKKLDFTFDMCSSLTNVVIPDGVTAIVNAFQNCTSLTVAPVIPESVTSLNGAFNGCVALTTAPVIPANVTRLYDTFGNCTSLTGTITINTNKIDNNNGYFDGTCRQCFNGVDMTNITLTGSASTDILNLIGATGNNWTPIQ